MATKLPGLPRGESVGGSRQEGVRAALGRRDGVSATCR